jgi:ATP-dependent helicase/nuclease subunit A
VAGPRNQVVFAPAGSGKTERLSNRYIELLEAGVAPERILTLTFTDKAAAEMKERIFKRLAERNPALHRELRRNALQLRISTIHAFCLTLVRRFAPTLGLDPRIDVLTAAEELWTAVKYDTLMAIAEDGDDRAAFDLLIELITRDDRIGWDKLSGLFDSFFARRVNIVRGRVRPVDRAELTRLAARLRADPLTRQLGDLATLLPARWKPAAVKAALDGLEARRGLFLTRGGTPLKPRGKGREPEREWNALCASYHGRLRQDLFAAEFARSFELFRQRFLAAYTRRKREAGQVDYDDMEYLALQLLATDPDWQNILRAFDEHTDHLLVDEFQDTSFLQWGIIDKLTEEWRSGEGAKADRGIEPTVFLVGDDKQSIFMFRDARVEVFSTAADRLAQWLGPDKLERITLEENYRSLDAVINFNNALFSRLMTDDPAAPAWRTRYAPFRRARGNAAPGLVEIILAPGAGSAEERRATDADTVARRIRALVAPAAPFAVHDRNPDGPEIARACEYRDIGIVFRTRKALPALEQALRAHDVPFIVGGGTGFYAEPEVRYAIALLAALVDPADGLALYATLRGPVFAVPEAAIFLGRAGDHPSLLENLGAGAAADSPVGRAIADLERWRARVPLEPLAVILEDALAEQKVWETFWEPQRLANLRRLLAIIESRAAGGEGPLRVLAALQAPGDEAKAEVRAEGRNAVQLMTVHTAKGLQFPVTIFPALDETIRPLLQKSGEELVIEETGPDEVLVSWLPDARLRRESEFHMTNREKQVEEEKRVFYVACTRAADALILTGTLHDRALQSTRLGWLVDCLGLDPEKLAFAGGRELPGVRVLAAADIPAPGPAPARARAARPRPRAVSPPPAVPAPRVEAITRNLPHDFARHSDDAINTGEMIHRILELISGGSLRYDELPGAADRLLAGLPPAARRYILDHLAALRADEPAWSVIAPQEAAENELPVMYTDGETVRLGRVDRVIITPDELRIYDYKTFPVRKADLETLVREYHDGQLRHYAGALRHVYPGRRVRTFLIFTALPRILETTPA